MFCVNVAVTEDALVAVQLPVPLHAPDQPENVEPDDAEAVSVIDEPVF